jgi:hypothetical protein
MGECKAHDYRYTKRTQMMAMNSKIAMMCIEQIHVVVAVTVSM